MYDKSTDRKLYEYFLDTSNCHKREGFSHIYDMSNEDFYIYMIAHMARHFYKRGCGVRNLIDIYVYNRKMEDILDLQYIKNKLKELGLESFENHMNELSKVWLEQRPCTDLNYNIFEYMLYCGVYGKDENGFWNKYRVNINISRQSTKDQKRKLKMWYIIPDISYMKEYYPYLEKYPFLLPFAWISRAISGLFDRKGMWKDKLKLIEHVDEETVNKMSEIYLEMGLDFHK